MSATDPAEPKPVSPALLDRRLARRHGRLIARPHAPSHPLTLDEWRQIDEWARAVRQEERDG